jgi:uncharacterized membrane protein HdeD (DUF308 family)
MKIKFCLFLFALLLVFNGQCSAASLSLSPEDANTLMQIIINIVTFVCGLLINPKKKDS